MKPRGSQIGLDYSTRLYTAAIPSTVLARSMRMATRMLLLDFPTPLLGPSPVFVRALPFPLRVSPPQGCQTRGITGAAASAPNTNYNATRDQDYIVTNVTRKKSEKKKQYIAKPRTPVPSDIASDDEFLAREGVSFSNLGLHPAVIEALSLAGCTRPAAVQVLIYSVFFLSLRRKALCIHGHAGTNIEQIR
jgi:hypothetical protein